MAKGQKKGMRIPGFRTGKRWKKIVACVYYGIAVMLIVGALADMRAKDSIEMLGVGVVALAIPLAIGFATRPKAAATRSSETTEQTMGFTADADTEQALRTQLRELQARYDLLAQSESQTTRTERSLQERLAELRSQILVAEETVEMESFSLYRPTYAFATSEEYKARLDKVREQQKAMIQGKTACTCSIQWTINNSAAEGRKHTEDEIKLFLRSFNNECDIAIAGAKFNNFDRCRERIMKSFETINKLGRVSKIALSPRYLELKVDELRLAYEYAQKKQEEKETQAEIRRQQREQAKLEKEIAEARKAAEKERSHFEQAVSNINAQIFACTDEKQRAELEARREELKSDLASVEDKLADIDYRQSNQRAGYVYIISNIGAFGEGIYKIGMTRRLDPMERVDELGDASVPFPFDVHALIFSADAPALETALHHAFEDRRVNKVNNRREYYRVSLDEIKAVVRANHDKTVEFTDIPLAEQYRESLKM